MLAEYDTNLNTIATAPGFAKRQAARELEKKPIHSGWEKRITSEGSPLVDQVSGISRWSQALDDKISLDFET